MPQASPQLPAPISHIFFRGCSEATASALLARLPFREGDLLSDDLLEQARQAATSLDGRLGIRINPDSREELLRLPPEARAAATVVDGGVNLTVFDAATRPQRIRAAPSDQAMMLMETVAPTPSPAGGGVVKLAIVVDKEGVVIDSIAIAGPAPLIPAALDAVRRWRYRPTRLNGHPVEVQTTVEVSFP